MGPVLLLQGGGKHERLECWGLVEKGGVSDGRCCYAAESPWALNGSTRGWPGFSYIMIQRFIWPIYWGLCQEPRCNKQSLCQFPNPSSTAPPFPLEVTGSHWVCFPVGWKAGEAVSGKYNQCHPTKWVWFLEWRRDLCVCVCVQP